MLSEGHVCFRIATTGSGRLRTAILPMQPLLCGTAQESRPTGEITDKTAQEARPTGNNAVAESRRIRRTALLSRLTGWNVILEKYALQVHERVERWLDQGMGSCVLNQALLAALVTSA